MLDDDGFVRICCDKIDIQIVFENMQCRCTSAELDAAKEELALAKSHAKLDKGMAAAAAENAAKKLHEVATEAAAAAAAAAVESNARLAAVREELETLRAQHAEVSDLAGVHQEKVDELEPEVELLRMQLEDTHVARQREQTELAEHQRELEYLHGRCFCW